MGSDAATANTSAPAVSKDLGGKKKKTNRSAKLKQCKLDARREQWLSQVKNKSCKVVNMHASPPSISPLPLSLHQMGKQNAPLGGDNSRMRSGREENDRTMVFHGGDLDSPANGWPSHVSGNNSAPKDRLDNSISIGSCLRSTGYAKNVDEKDIVRGEGRGCGDGSLDDWESVADTLTSGETGCSTPSSKCTAAINESTGSAMPQNGDGILTKPEPDRRIPTAWRPDDVFRPRTLPKQHNCSLDSQLYCSQGTMSWAHRGITAQPSFCPICFEDLDLTDSSFLPCSCGFRLCLFCHKRILEADGRCPGCRKPYSPLGNGEMSMSGGGMPLLSLQMSHSYSMSSIS